MMHGVPSRVMRRPEYLQPSVRMGLQPSAEPVMPDEVMAFSQDLDMSEPKSGLLSQAYEYAMDNPVKTVLGAFALYYGFNYFRR